ncbi:hypothetical protein OPKNFCMD_4393 [Methylobacterium crusticola]|uniref:Cytochrome c domain-containing protein n=1 Tax=Methylobacterium crusticola TaxID=1697972 RepID=A0ABQ4R1T9_9HYPH|nr:cytochrome c [Methylobacterium crusticola]GJD51638.1 hypothetical protein OPKNFCMD_4393 [Methylobacterium crusticola]
MRRIIAHALGSVSLAVLALGGARAQGADPDLVKRGELLATAGDCVACHTAPGGKLLAGGYYLTFPLGLGKVATPNITPDKETGIGDWSDEDFRRLMQDGITRSGSYIYPAMPFPWYTRVSTEDIRAIKAYLFSLAPVSAPRKPNDLVFPLNLDISREGLLGWRLAFFTNKRFEPDPARSPQINRGAYLVQGLGHCGACHNGSKLVGTSQWAGYLEGGTTDQWFAPNLSGDDKEGLGAWTEDQLFTYLKTGAASGRAGVAAGPMRQVIDESLSKLPDDDVRAIAVYLKTLPAKSTYEERTPSAFDQSAPPGSQAYLSHCVSCHRQDGKGVPGAFPALAGNGAVLAQGPETVIRVILGGLSARGEYAAMPAVGAGMTDEEVAQVTNYVRQSFGNQAPATAKPGQVGTLRADTASMLAGNGSCEPVANADVARALDEPDAAAQLRDVKAEDMLPRINAVLPKVKAAAPQASQADLVNGLTARFCQVANRDAAGPTWPVALGNFASLVYGQIKNPDRASK